MTKTRHNAHYPVEMLLDEYNTRWLWCSKCLYFWDVTFVPKGSFGNVRDYNCEKCSRNPENVVHLDQEELNMGLRCCKKR